jgi:hypothetical protein
MPRAKQPETLYLRSRALAGSPLGRFLVRAAAVAALLLVGGMVMRQARAQAYRLTEYQLTPASLAFESLPSWADARTQAALRAPDRIAFRVSVFDPAAEQRVRLAVARHPLVRSVDAVRVTYPDRVAVRVTLRVPGCWVETPVKRADGRPYLFLLSTDARRLDDRCYGAYLLARAPLPVLTGVKDIGPPVDGVGWDNIYEQVAEGLAAAAVAERLAGELDFGRGDDRRFVARIDVGRFPARGDRLGGEVLLVLSDGTAIEWGRTEREPDGIEDGYPTKALRLDLALKDPRTRRVDVRFQPGDLPLPR